MVDNQRKVLDIGILDLLGHARSKTLCYMYLYIQIKLKLNEIQIEVLIITVCTIQESSCKSECITL